MDALIYCIQGMYSIYNKRVETFAIEMETQLDVFLRRQYPNENGN